MLSNVALTAAALNFVPSWKLTSSLKLNVYSNPSLETSHDVARPGIYISFLSQLILIDQTYLQLTFLHVLTVLFLDLVFSNPGLSSAKTISNAFAVLIKERLENIKVIPRAIFNNILILSPLLRKLEIV